MLTNAEVDQLRGHLTMLALKLADLDESIAESDDVSRATLTTAFGAMNGMATILDPALAVADDE